MTTKQINKIVEELKDFPDSKAESLLDYLYFLKNEEFITNMKIPNEETEQVFKDTDAGKNLITCKDADDMFNQLGI
jgi:hypothetical protein